MIFEKTTRVRAPLQKVWEFVWDMKKLTSCIEGCENVEEVEPKKKYTAQVGTKIGRRGTHQSEGGGERLEDRRQHETADRTAAKRGFQRRDGAEFQGGCGHPGKVGDPGPLDHQ
jgi:carbon monoxide dehydrogenase subunit G